MDLLEVDEWPRPTPRVSTGFSALDRVFGTSWRTGEEGIVHPSLTMIEGKAGIGKTIVTLAIATAPTHDGTFWGTVTDDPEDILHQASIWFVASDLPRRIDFMRVGSLGAFVSAAARSKRPIVVLDDLRDLDPDRRKMANVVQALRCLVNDHQKTVIIVARDSPSGRSTSDAGKIQHTVDTIMRIEPHESSKDLRTIRCPFKNRNGDILESAELVFQGGPIVIRSPT